MMKRASLLVTDFMLFVILVFQILFVYKTNDFNFLSFNPKKFREL